MQIGKEVSLLNGVYLITAVFELQTNCCQTQQKIGPDTRVKVSVQANSELLAQFGEISTPCQQAAEQALIVKFVRIPLKFGGFQCPQNVEIIYIYI